MTPRTRALLPVGIVAAIALAVRVHFASGRELWYDDVARLRLSFLSWAGVWEQLPREDNLKSPWLIGLHKAWTEIAGTGSLLAIRGLGIVCGVAIVIAAAVLMRRLAGPVAAVVAAVFYALAPFFVEWSVWVHNYAPALLAAMAVWVLAAGTGPWTLGKGVLAGACAGLAVGIFPPTGAALLPVLMTPRVRESSWNVRLAALGAAVLVAAPALVSMARSQEAFAPAATAGVSWMPYFHRWKTPTETLARILGSDLGAGRAGPVHLVGLLFVGAVCAARVAFASDRRTAPDAWRLRLAFALACVLPVVVLYVASVLGLRLFSDRYLHAVAGMLPLAALAALASPEPTVGPRAFPLVTRAAGAILLATFLVGVGTYWMRGESQNRLGYRAAALLDREGAARHPPRVHVHGEAQASHVALRSALAAAGAIEVRHLLPQAWLDLLRADDRSHVAVPLPYGWPFGAAILAPRVRPATRADLQRDLAQHGEAWLLVEHGAAMRVRMLEEEEQASGLDAIWIAAATPAGPERDERIASAARTFANADGLSVDVASQDNAVLVRMRVR